MTRLSSSTRHPGIPTPSEIEPQVLDYMAGRRCEFGLIYAEMVRRFRISRELEMVRFDYASGDPDAPPSGKNVFYKYCNRVCRDLFNEGRFNYDYTTGLYSLANAR